MIRNYLLTAWKVFMRRKLYTAINLLCVVLTLVVLMVITTVLEYTFFPSGVEGKSDHFLQVANMEWTGNDGHHISSSPLGYKTIATYLKPLKSAELVAAVTGPQSVSVYQDGRVLSLQMRRADAEYWKILDFKVLAGRVPDAADVAAGRYVAVISASTARQLFGDAAALGRKLNIGESQFEVIGVVEDTSHLNSFADIWAPVTTFPSTAYRDQQAGNFTALLLAHDRAGLKAIQDEVEQAARRYQFDDPVDYQNAYFWADSKMDMFARALGGHDEERDSGAGQMLTVIAVAMLIFMSLPALNMVNLNVGRIMERSSEIGVRKAFGATSGQLVLQLVVENVLLCVAGGVLSYAAAYGVLAFIAYIELIPSVTVVPAPNASVFACALLISGVFGLMSGLVPAWKMSRLDPVEALKGGA